MQYGRLNCRCATLGSQAFRNSVGLLRLLRTIFKEEKKKKKKSIVTDTIDSPYIFSAAMMAAVRGDRSGRRVATGVVLGCAKLSGSSPEG